MNDENFPPLSQKKPPDPTESSMDTEHPHHRPGEMQQNAISRRRSDFRDFEQIQKEAEQQESLAEQHKGELLSLGSCPIQDCQFHSNLNATQILKQRKEEALKFQLLLASNISNSNSNVTENNIPKSQEIKKKTNRVEGFTSPVKTAKKQKILQNYSIGVDAPINVHNKFNALAGSSAMPVSVSAAVPVAPPKPPRSPSSTLSLLTTTTWLCRRSRESGLNPGQNYRGIPEDSCLHRGRAPRDHCLP
ncbi:hypothetical protein TNCV_4240361 [Trichonephila clavipes]|nr:hypothetical protein TNCV_4240361 [Trichonephila clavipes]